MSAKYQPFSSGLNVLDIIQIFRDAGTSRVFTGVFLGAVFCHMLACPSNWQLWQTGEIGLAEDGQLQITWVTKQPLMIDCRGGWLKIVLHGLISKGYDWFQRDGIYLMCISWRRQDMETLSALLALCEGNHQPLVDSPHKVPAMWTFGIFLFLAK